MNLAVKDVQQYSEQAYAAFNELDTRATRVFAQVRAWRGWQLIHDPDTPREDIIRLVREISRSVVMYQSHTTKAGFHMFGRAAGAIAAIAHSGHARTRAFLSRCGLRNESGDTVGRIHR